jgi:hypothetical protein
MRRFIGIILNAKYRVEKDHQDIGVIISLDDEELKPLMTKALRRYFNALRSNEKHIKNVGNYLYGTMQNLFGVWWNKQAAREYAAKHPEEQNTDNGRFLELNVTWTHLSRFKCYMHKFYIKIVLKSLRSKNRHLEWLNWR